MHSLLAILVIICITFVIVDAQFGMYGHGMYGRGMYGGGMGRRMMMRNGMYGGGMYNPMMGMLG